MRWGYLNSAGKVIISPVYATAEAFDEQGFAIVGVKQGKDLAFGLINRAGEYAAKPVYSYIERFAPNLYLVFGKDEQKLIKANGQQLRSVPDRYIKTDAAGMARFQQDNLYGYLDAAGNTRIFPQYSYATPFSSDGKAVVVLPNKKYALIGKNGQQIRQFPFTADQVTLQGFQNGLALYYDKTKQMNGYMDENGKLVIPLKFADASSFQDGLAVVQTDVARSTNGLINAKGSFIIPAKYAAIFPLGGGLWAVGKNVATAEEEEAWPGVKTFAIADRTGRFLTDFVYDRVEAFSGKYAAVQSGLSTFFIDQTGKKAAELPTFAGIGTAQISGDVITATIDDRLQYAKRDGSLIWKSDHSTQLAPGLLVKEAKLRPHRNYLAYYPVISGLSDKKIEQAINERIKQSVTPSDGDFEGTEINYDFAVVMHKKQLLILERSGYVHPIGAAHGMPEEHYSHIDLKTGQLYQLKDLFKPGSAYEKRINELIGKQIKEKGEELGLFPEVKEKFDGISQEQGFYVDEQSLNIYFYPYDIGPYAAGFIEFKLPFTDLKDLIDEQGAFWQSFHE